MDVQRQKGMQRAFQALAFGDPVGHDGEDRRAAHREADENGLTEEHFTPVAGHLARTLAELNVLL